MLDELLALSERAVEMARGAGADEAWAGTNRTRSVEFTYRDDQLEKVQESTSQGLGIELYVDGRYSTHSTTDLNEDRLQSFLAEAVALTRALEVDPDRQIPDAALFENRPTHDLDIVDPSLAAIEGEQREAWCAAMVERARQHDRVISASGDVADYHSQSASASSNGFSGTREGTSIWCVASVTLQDEGDARPEGSYWAGARYMSDLPDIPEIGTNGLAQAVARLGATQGPTRRTNMVVDRRSGRRLFSALLGPANARSISRGRSFYTDQIGKTLFSEKLTLIDDPFVSRGFGSRLFDREGISARQIPIIQEGRLENIYVDTYYGRKTGMTPTTGGGSNQMLTLGERGLDAILADVGEGIYVTSWLGGNSDSTTGDFSFGIRGHLIENGTIGAPVSEMNVTGNLIELFVNLAEVGNDPWLYSAMPTPTLVFEGVQFSGS